MERAWLDTFSLSPQFHFVTSDGFPVTKRHWFKYGPKCGFLNWEHCFGLPKRRVHFHILSNSGSLTTKIEWVLIPKGNCCFRVKNKDKMYFPKKCLYPKLSKYYLVLQINKAISRHFLEQNWMQCIPAATTDTFKRYIQFNVIFLPAAAAYLFWVNAHPISVVWQSLHWNVWKCQLFFRKVHNKNF